MNDSIYIHICRRLQSSPAAFDDSSAPTLDFIDNDHDRRLIQQSPCLVWTARLPRFKFNQKTYPVQRFVFEHAYGHQLSTSEQVLQWCTRSRVCCQPAHLLAQNKYDFRNKFIKIPQLPQCKPQTICTNSSPTIVRNEVLADAQCLFDFIEPDTPVSVVAHDQMPGSDCEGDGMDLDDIDNNFKSFQ